MKLLLLHCDKVEYVDRYKSSRPLTVGTCASAPMTEGFSDVLLVLTCCEVDDNDCTIGAAVREVQKTLATIQPKGGIVLMPFAHLSADLAEPRIAYGLLKALRSHLSSSRSAVHLATFGWHKELALRVRGHPVSVGFRSIAAQTPDSFINQQLSVVS